MQRNPVESSTIASLGHDGDTLDIVFKGGQPKDGKTVQVYRFSGVPAEVHERMLAADSIGRFFQTEIRNAKHPETGAPLYPFEKLTELKEDSDGK